MQDIDRDPANLENLSLRKFARPRPFVDIAPDRGNGSKPAELIENFSFAHVSGVEDVCRAAQSVDCFRPKQSMRVGDDADDSLQF